MMFTKHWMKLLSIYVNIVGNFMGCCDNHSSSEGWSLLGSIPNEHVSPSNCKVFWMFTPKSKRVLSSMCQHGVGNEGHQKPYSFSFAHILQAQGVIGIIIQTITILRLAIIISEGFFRVGVLSKGPPLSLFYMFIATCGVSNT